MAVKKKTVKKKVQKAVAKKMVKAAKKTVRTAVKTVPTQTNQAPVNRRIILRASHIRKAFEGNEVLKDVSLELHEGEVMLLQGDNGSGKTTLINILTGNLMPSRGRITLGTDPNKIRHFRFPIPFWRRTLSFTYFSPERFAKEGLARMWQDVRLFSSQSLKDNIVVAKAHQRGENPLRALITPWQIDKDEATLTQMAKETLKKFGLEGRENSSGSRVSLGQSKRVAIARAIYSGAKILFLDEPLAGLDNEGIKQMLDFLHYLVKERNTSIVIVEHAFNIPKILDLVDGVLTLKDGVITRNTKEEVFKEEVKQHKDAMMEWLTAFAGQNGRTDVLALPNGARLTIARKDPSAPSVFTVNNLTVSRGHRPVIIEPLSFDIHKGDIAMLEAPNGWGKSTLMDAITGVISPKTGSIMLHGEHITNWPIWERVKKGLLLSRSGDVLFKSINVEENKKLAHVKHEELGAKFLKRQAGSLSGGENRRVSLGLALYQTKKDMVLLDEPFQAMDTAQEELARGKISLEAHNGKTFLITIPKIYE
ncbi:MAG: ATP-binding cassette domain-containing protein [Alphaproteobacteria bacterium]|nr:ATP-binding cassette domain-containing protein [Alphaproteobacteria bacterium]